MNNKNKILIFVVAYNAEKHITRTLDRIPEELSKRYLLEILIIDDMSSDDTFLKAERCKKSNAFKITNLKNAVNQGYGGNQKLGYNYAIKNNFDAVVLLHGDGQYAPEVIDDLILPIVVPERKRGF